VVVAYFKDLSCHSGLGKRKTMKTHGQDSMCYSRNSNWTSPKYKLEVLAFGLTCSALLLLLLLLSLVLLSFGEALINLILILSVFLHDKAIQEFRVWGGLSFQKTWNVCSEIVVCMSSLPLERWWYHNRNCNCLPSQQIHLKQYFIPCDSL
jgi:hypothetical protein